MFAPRWFSVAALILMVPAVTIAEDRIWTGAADSDFFNAASWEGGAPTTDEDLAVVDGGENFPMVIRWSSLADSSLERVVKRVGASFRTAEH